VTAEGSAVLAAFLPTFEEVGAYEDAFPEFPGERLQEKDEIHGIAKEGELL
jgi:hypothetical protein